VGPENVVPGRVTTALNRILEVPASRRADLVAILDRLRAAKHVVLTTHVNADGDGTGSEAAVAAWLESVGVRATIVNPTPFPRNLLFLAHREDVVVELDDPRLGEVLGSADLVLVLDTSEENRLGALHPRIDGIPTLVIDHHPAGPSVVGEGGVQDPSASSAGELVYDLLTLSGDPWNPASVQGVYVAIVSDTGSFRFGNTTPRAHAIAAELLGRGIDPESVFQRLFATAPLRRIHLLREALGGLEHDPDLGITWIVVPLRVSEELASTAEDFDGIIEHARAIQGTRVSLMFREIAPGETKVSFRSADVDVNRIARKFGGGGHVKASGASVPLPPDEAVDAVLHEVRSALAGEG
jgi:bifunctional oligoribonuclease and PAP phosphatase NrnA